MRQATQIAMLGAALLTAAPTGALAQGRPAQATNAQKMQTNAMAEVQHEAAVSVLKKTMDIQEQSAMQLLQAIPQPPAPVASGTSGGYIDTWA